MQELLDHHRDHIVANLGAESERFHVTRGEEDSWQSGDLCAVSSSQGIKRPVAQWRYVDEEVATDDNSANSRLSDCRRG